MDWAFQRKQVKPKAKSCEWCRYFYNFNCSYEKNEGITHRLFLKLKREDYNFRYCKYYKYSKDKFKDYKSMCEENAKATGYSTGYTEWPF